MLVHWKLSRSSRIRLRSTLPFSLAMGSPSLRKEWWWTLYHSTPIRPSSVQPSIRIQTSQNSCPKVLLHKPNTDILSRGLDYFTSIVCFQNDKAEAKALQMYHLTFVSLVVLSMVEVAEEDNDEEDADDDADNDDDPQL